MVDDHGKHKDNFEKFNFHPQKLIFLKISGNSQHQNASTRNKPQHQTVSTRNKPKHQNASTRNKPQHQNASTRNKRLHQNVSTRNKPKHQNVSTRNKSYLISKWRTFQETIWIYNQESDFQVLGRIYNLIYVFFILVSRLAIASS